MAQIVLNIPDAVINRVIAALCNQTGATPTASNAKQALIAIIMRLIKNYESTQAQQNVIATAEQKVTTDIQIN
jgi:hypothetical protein